MKPVTSTQAKTGGIEIDVRQFILNAMEYRLPTLFPELPRARAEYCAEIIEANMGEEGLTMAPIIAALQAEGVTSDTIEEDVNDMVNMVMCAVDGLGIDMLTCNYSTDIIWE